MVCVVDVVCVEIGCDDYLFYLWLNGWLVVIVGI